MPLATFLSEKVAVPPVKVTASVPMIPFGVRVRTVAFVLPSYTLLDAVNEPVIPRAVMLAVVAAVVLLL